MPKPSAALRRCPSAPADGPSKNPMAPRKMPAGRSQMSLTSRIAVLGMLAVGGVTVRYLFGSGGSGAEQAPAVVLEDPATARTPAEFVERTIKRYPVTVFSKSYCPFSKRGKALMFRYLGEDGVHVVELDEREDGGDIQDALQQLTGARTVPRIFVGENCIGGSDDAHALDAAGKLEALLKEKNLI